MTLLKLFFKLAFKHEHQLVAHGYLELWTLECFEVFDFFEELVSAYVLGLVEGVRNLSLNWIKDFNFLTEVYGEVLMLFSFELGHRLDFFLGHSLLRQVFLELFDEILHVVIQYLGNGVPNF